MKKFLITLLFLIIAGGTAFIFGWVQIQIPLDTYVVLYTKTGGVEEEIVHSGKFTWRWQRLIPTNMKKYAFELKEESRRVTVEGELPSKDIYAEYMLGNPDFSWKVRVNITYFVKPESLPELVREDKVTPDTLSDYYAFIGDNLQGAVVQSILERISSGEARSLSSLTVSDLEETLYTRMEGEFPHIEIRDLFVEPLKFPDLSLYQAARDRYLRLTETQFRIREEELARTTAEEVTETSRIEKLREYGKLLSEYPVLMDFVKIKGSFSELLSSEFTGPSAVPEEVSGE